MAEKLAHTLDLMRAEIGALRAELVHQKEFHEHRLAALEEDAKDHEQRLRSNTEGVTQFKQWSGLAAGGSSIMSIVALLKSFISP
jgi:hypothetical protein